MAVSASDRWRQLIMQYLEVDDEMALRVYELIGREFNFSSLSMTEFLQLSLRAYRTIKRGG